MSTSPARSGESAGHLPLKPLVFQILLVLLEGERHGYAIVKQVEANTGAEIRIEPGNLYRTLRTMETQGLIEEADSRPDPELDDQRRKYFRITPVGDEAVRLETTRIERLAVAARARLAEASAGKVAK